MPAEFELVIFDMDDVLGHLDRAKRLTILAQITGHSPAFLDERIWTSDFEAAAERGAYPTGEEYLAEFNRRIARQVTRTEWIRARRDATTPDREVLRIAREISRHLPIAVLTNNGSLLKESLADILPDVADLFGLRAHASFEFGARKPEPLLFERLLARYAVAPSNALFIDDNEEYIAGARQVGLKCIRFTTAPELRQSLTTLGVLNFPTL